VFSAPQGSSHPKGWVPGEQRHAAAVQTMTGSKATAVIGLCGGPWWMWGRAPETNQLTNFT